MGTEIGESGADPMHLWGQRLTHHTSGKDGSHVLSLIMIMLPVRAAYNSLQKVGV